MRASVIGATGFAGAELLRLLDGHPQAELAYITSEDGHPQAELAYITSESSTGEDIAAMYPHLRGRIEKQLISMNELEKIANGSDVIFIALPHGHAMKIGKMLWYKVPHADPEAKAVYGLTELYRKDVAGAELVANPGCYTTCSILALVPLLKAGLIETKGIVVDAKSGTTGAGRGLKLGSLYCSVNENFHAYGVATHRHTPEIEQIYSEFAGEDAVIQFTPHLLPVDRGILATCYAMLKPGVTDADIENAFKEMYGGEFFIRLLGKGACPEIKNIRASNYVDIGWQTDARTGRVIVMSALDNLVKGAAGQAVQNMNVMFGIDETTGLRQLPVYP